MRQRRSMLSFRNEACFQSDGVIFGVEDRRRRNPLRHSEVVIIGTLETRSRGRCYRPDAVEEFEDQDSTDDSSCFSKSVHVWNNFSCDRKVIFHQHNHSSVVAENISNFNTRNTSYDCFFCAGGIPSPALPLRRP